MSRLIKISGRKQIELSVQLCESFWSRFSGLMFKKNINPNEGILLKCDNNSILNSSIHMFFMNFPISVFWMNQSFEVVDKTYALPWHPIYIPHTPAMYILEAHPSQQHTFEIGEKITKSDA
jgi:hypothetical protein